MAILRLLTALLLTVLVGCGKGDPEDRHTGEGRVKAEDHQFSLVPPYWWIAERDPVGILEFKQWGDRKYASNVHVVALSNGSGRSLEEMRPIFIENWRPQSWPQLDDGYSEIDGKKAYFVTWHNTIHDFMETNYFVPSGSTVYAITFRIGSSNLEKEKADVEAALDSIRID